MENLYVVIRNEGNVIVSIMFSRHSGKYHFVNLTKGHICSCAFDSVNDAIGDMKKKKDNAEIVDYIRIK